MTDAEKVKQLEEGIERVILNIKMGFTWEVANVGGQASNPLKRLLEDTRAGRRPV